MGGSPYPGLPMESLFEFLQNGGRMQQPATCPDELYQVMLQCWESSLYERPHFHELVGQLEGILTNKLQVGFFLVQCIHTWFDLNY